MPAAYRAVQKGPSAFNQEERKGRQPRHFEATHVGSEWTLDMKKEVELGLAPAEWSTTSQMNDPRPNGKQIFDARHCGSPMGRARGGYSLMADARGIAATKGETAKAVNMDSNWFATDMADETAAAAESADRNELGNQNLAGFKDAKALELAQMSQLQRSQLDKDGDGQVEDDEWATFKGGRH